MNPDALADFLAAVDAGGISAGAARRGVSKQTLSRRIIDLERDLAIRLFDRSARAIRLTAEGELLRERATRHLAELAETRALFADREKAPRGRLRVSAPHLLGQTLLGAVAARLVRAHPHLQLEVVLSDQKVDLVEDGFDAAVRVGPRFDGELVSRLIGTAGTVLVAAPGLVAGRSVAAKPEDLADLPAVVFGKGGSRARLTLTSAGRTVQVELPGRIATNSLKLCLDAAIAGGGVAAVPAFVARPHLERGELIRLLPDWELPTSEVRIVFPSRRLMSPRLRVFIDETAVQLRATDL